MPFWAKNEEKPSITPIFWLIPRVPENPTLDTRSVKNWDLGTHKLYFQKYQPTVCDALV